eukprot:GDKK01023457.1.p1 GENE.GDKK01023457.1~~GDKK01023457.1.p1  ORF type:complete len:516 (+),score=72.86 GDKK01023457.1:98-1549(+)
MNKSMPGQTNVASTSDSLFLEPSTLDVEKLHSSDDFVFSDDETLANCRCLLNPVFFQSKNLASLATVHHTKCPWASFNPDCLPPSAVKLSQGLESAVYRVLDENDQPVAWKITDKSRLNNFDGLAQQRLEAHLMMSSRSQPYIAHLLCCTESPSHLSLFFEYISGGDLHSSVGVRTLCEDDARAIAHDCLQGLLYLHDRAIIHGDIKPHNILLHELPPCDSVILAPFLTDEHRQQEPQQEPPSAMMVNSASSTSTSQTLTAMTAARHTIDTLETRVSNLDESSSQSLITSPPSTAVPLPSRIVRARLTDLGMAHILPSPSAKKTSSELMGTSGFLSPEVLRREAFGTSADIFALGVVLFMLLGGYEPFFPISTCCDSRTDGRNVVGFDCDAFRNVSAPCRDLVAWMLSTDPCLRPSARECLEHEWLRMDRPSAGAKICCCSERDKEDRSLVEWELKEGVQFEMNVLCKLKAMQKTRDSEEGKS